MTPTESRVAKPERWWDCCHGTGKHWRLVIHAGLSLARLTSPCHNMYADMIQENNLTQTR